MNAITLYKDNLLANKEDVRYEDIYSKFKGFPYFIEYYPNVSFTDCLRWYVTSKEGIHSAYDNEEAFNALYTYCWDKFKEDTKLK